jgi:N4-gp56 family major capsid protein
MATQVYGNGTNSSQGANTITHFYDRAGVKAATEVNVYGQWADKKYQPTKYGKTFKISKWLHIYDRLMTDSEFASKGYLSSRDIADVSTGLSDAALTEGAGRVNERSVKKITMETSFSRYGEMIPYTDEVDLFSEDNVQVHYREELGRLANRRVEDLIQMDMLSTGNVQYAGVATAIGEVGPGTLEEEPLYKVSYDLIRKGMRRLVRNRAEKNTSMVTGSTKVDTRTIARAYYGIIGPEVKYDLETVKDASGELAFVPAYKYGDAASLAEGEVGAMHDARFIESESAVVYRGQGKDAIAGTTLSTTNGKCDVFPILFPTKGSFATVGLRGKGKIKFNAISPENKELNNPYQNQGLFSYNFFYAGIVLQEERLLKILVNASA